MKNLKVHKALNLILQPDDQPHPASVNNGANTSTAAGKLEAGSAAPATSAAPAPGRAAQCGGPAGLAPARRRSCKTPLLSVKFDSGPQQLGNFLSQIWTFMQEYGPKIATEGSKARCVIMEGAAARSPSIIMTPWS